MQQQTFSRLTGMPEAIPNGSTGDIRFVLSVSEGEPIMCVARYGVAAQIAAGLGSALDVLRTALAAQGATEPVAPTEIREVRVQKAFLADMMVVELITTMGIPYIFQFPSQMSEAIADRLKTEAAKDHPAGRA